MFVIKPAVSLLVVCMASDIGNSDGTPGTSLMKLNTESSGLTSMTDALGVTETGQFFPNLQHTPQWWQSDVLPENGILKALFGRSAASANNMNTLLVSLLSGRREQLPAYAKLLATAARNRINNKVSGPGTTHNHASHAHSHHNHAHGHHNHAHDHHNHAHDHNNHAHDHHNHAHDHTHHHHDHTHHHHNHTHTHGDYIHAHSHDNHNHTHDLQLNATYLINNEHNITAPLDQNKTIDYQLNGTYFTQAQDNQSTTPDIQNYTSHNRTTSGHLNIDTKINKAAANETQSLNKQNETYTQNQTFVNQPDANSNESHVNQSQSLGQQADTGNGSDTQAYSIGQQADTGNGTDTQAYSIGQQADTGNGSDTQAYSIGQQADTGNGSDTQAYSIGQQADTGNGSDTQAYSTQYRTYTLDQRSEPQGNTLPYHYEPQKKQLNTPSWLQTLQRQYWISQIFQGIRALYSQGSTNYQQSASGATGPSGNQGNPNTLLELILLLLRQYTIRTMSTNSGYGGEPEKPWSDGVFSPYSTVATQSSTPVAASSSSTNTAHDNTLTNMLAGHTEHYNANAASHNTTAENPMHQQYNVLQPDSIGAHSSTQYNRQPIGQQSNLIGTLQRTITPTVKPTQPPRQAVHNPSTVYNFSPFGNNQGSQTPNSEILSAYAWNFGGEMAHGNEHATGQSVAPEVSSDRRGNMTESQYERTLDILSRQPANPTVYYPGQVVNPAYQYAGLSANPTAQYAGLNLNPTLQYQQLQARPFDREATMEAYRFGAEPEEAVI